MQLRRIQGTYRTTKRYPTPTSDRIPFAGRRRDDDATSGYQRRRDLPESAELRCQLRDRKGRRWVPGVRLPKYGNLRAARHRHRVDGRRREEDLSRSKVRLALRTGIGDGRKRLHVLQVPGTRFAGLPASARMQETMRLWLQDEQTRLSGK